MLDESRMQSHTSRNLHKVLLQKMVGKSNSSYATIWGNKMCNRTDW